VLSHDDVGHEAIADVLRNELDTGHLPPGGRFPSERDIQRRFSVGRDTARDAISVLRHEGRIVVRRGHASRVRPDMPKQEIVLEPGQTVDVRMPTPREKRDLGIVGDGVPVFVVCDPDGVGDLYPGDRFRIVQPGEGGA
jgi:GntR family transcriptional regulator